MTNQLKVLYIAGLGRSGSTILQNVLGELESFFPGGEICSIGQRYVQKRLCGCKKPLAECDVWKRVLNRAFGQFDRGKAVELNQLLRCFRTRHLPVVLTSWGRRRMLSQTAGSRNVIERMYSTIWRESGAQVIIDSSKDPLFGFLLSTLDSIDAYFLHLVRDPRGVAFSYQRRRRLDGRRGRIFQTRFHPAKSALLWNAWNVAAQNLLGTDSSRYMRLRYEDLVQQPRESLEQVLSFVGEPGQSLPFISSRTVQLGGNHTVGGNPARFRTGVVELQPDDEWKTAMKPAHKGLVTALTWPLMNRYGYQWSVPEESLTRATCAGYEPHMASPLQQTTTTQARSATEPQV